MNEGMIGMISTDGGSRPQANTRSAQEYQDTDF